MDRLWWELPLRLGHGPDATWRGEFATAVGEIAANIVRHACPAAGDLCDARLAILVNRVAIVARFTDRGAPCVAPIPAGPPIRSAEAPWEWPEAGLGLGLARAALDDLGYERTAAGENRWTLLKRLESADR
ncbi:MAG: ATP-binding protein [Chloroflexia bacterium]|nr:ATP-binding protein [Chloroflexia bacterium]